MGGLLHWTNPTARQKLAICFRSPWMCGHDRQFFDSLLSQSASANDHGQGFCCGSNVAGCYRVPIARAGCDNSPLKIIRSAAPPGSLLCSPVIAGRFCGWNVSAIIHVGCASRTTPPVADWSLVVSTEIVRLTKFGINFCYDFRRDIQSLNSFVRRTTSSRIVNPLRCDRQNSATSLVSRVLQTCFGCFVGVVFIAREALRDFRIVSTPRITIFLESITICRIPNVLFGRNLFRG